MNKKQLRVRIEEIGLVRVIRTSSEADGAAVEEGPHRRNPHRRSHHDRSRRHLRCVLFREIVRSVPKVIIGAGTVLDAITASECMKGGRSIY